jgi:lipoprotein-anchoring transpeptidase ErfK/SrfK
MLTYYNLMKNILLFLSFLVLSGLIATRSSWAYLFSHQDRINPEEIVENYDPSAKLAIFNNKKVNIPPQQFTSNHILGVEDENNKLGLKKIEVDLTTQKLYAYENNQVVYEFLVSTGTWDRTPTGTFKIWAKIRSQKMSGGSKELGTYYYLPNVPYILFFGNAQVPNSLGYSLHGTYWHNNFGVPMSHGCVNMKTPEVAQIFDWATLDTPITIYGKYETSLPATYHP